VKFFHARFDAMPVGMWPSEQSVCEQIVPMLIKSGIKWIVADEGVLFKSVKTRKKTRDTRFLYQPHLLKREEGQMSIIFRDRNLSDLIGFTYHHWKAEDAVKDFLYHMDNTYNVFKKQDILLTIAMDGENAWEYFRNDGHEFLELLYERLSETSYLKCVTISEYLNLHPAKHHIHQLAAGSWIYSEFGKWIGNPYKTKAWEWLAAARAAMEELIQSGKPVSDLAWKQMMICEGSDWFWWAGEDPMGDFDRLFRMHLSNLYTIIGVPAPDYLKTPLEP
jgi:alpha-amylase/alpha-mannosidase (GH57 family)